MDYLLLTCLAVSFITTYLLMPYWIRAAVKTGLVGKDMNKFEQPEVAEFGGVVIVAGAMAGILTYIGLSTFYFNSTTNLVLILAAVSTILGITIVGMLDDLLGWKVGLAQWQKPLLTLPVALPMMVVNAGESTMNLPFLGAVDFGILYPLIIIPLGIVGAASGYNMLAGYNGLEAGMGVIILSVLGFVAWQGGYGWVAVFSLCMVFALLAFLKYNWYPAKVFPGDTATYSIGALIACVAILGNMEKIALVLFLPYVLDFILPIRSRFKIEAFAKVNEDESLEMPCRTDYKGIYDVTHLAIFVLKKIKNKVYEKDVVASILAFEAVLGCLTILWMA